MGWVGKTGPFRFYIRESHEIQDTTSSNNALQVVAKDVTCPVCDASPPTPAFRDNAANRSKGDVMRKHVLQALIIVILHQNEAARTGSDRERTGSEFGVDPERGATVTTPLLADANASRGCCKTFWLFVLQLLMFPLCVLYMIFLLCFTFFLIIILGFVLVFVSIKQFACKKDAEVNEEAETLEDKVLAGFSKVLEKVMTCCLFPWCFGCCQATFECFAVLAALMV